MVVGGCNCPHIKQLCVCHPKGGRNRDDAHGAVVRCCLEERPLSCMAKLHCDSAARMRNWRDVPNKSLIFAGNVLEACHALNGLALIKPQLSKISTRNVRIDSISNALQQYLWLQLPWLGCRMLVSSSLLVTLMKQRIILIA